MTSAALVTPTQREAIERRRAFHASIAARAVPQRQESERSFGMKGYIKINRVLKVLEPERVVAIEPDPPPPLSIVWPAVASGEAIDDEVHQTRIQIEQIIHAVCARFGVSKEALISHRKMWRLVYARQVGMYLARHLTDKTYPRIGRSFGNRDHTTAMHAHRKITQLLLTDSALAHDIACLIEQLTGVQS